ncbi:nematode resistance protein-like HSPRO2 [Arachis hypogaea]|uniref:nematode resistance protein-like HSPRO2 n=1 Tax=Arachis hypogaea TaxID=3818 RepID=UPI003B228DDB
MDPNDLMKLKKQIEIPCFGDTAAFCFRSKELVEVTKMCREMKRMMSEMLEVEVDPKGGPGIVEAAMRVHAEKKESVVEVLQAMQGIEAAMKRFFFGYK